MKHKLTTFIMVLALISVFAVPAFAGSTDGSYTTRETKYYEDGSYDVIVTTVDVPQTSFLAATNSKTASTTYHHFENNVKQWDFTLKGTFEYNGSTAKATAASCSYAIFDSNWKCITKKSWTSGATAKASATFKRISSVDVTIGLKCSPSGAITAA